MPNWLSKNSILLLPVICIAFVLYFHDVIWSGSTDLGQHYALAARLADKLMLTADYPTLGIMNIYPRAGHFAAAGVGALMGSTLLGVQIVALSAVSVLWLCAVLMLGSLPRLQAALTMMALLILLVINKLVFRLDLHGREIVENFFFAQLVGHCFLFVAILLSIYLERSKNVLWAIALLVPTMLLNINTHLLPAVETLGLIAGLLLAYVLFDRKGRLSARYRVLVALPIMAFSIALLVLHPQFATMKMISANDGWLSLKNISYPVGILALCLLLLMTSALTFRMWLLSDDRRGCTAIKYLAVYGAVTASLCIFQYLLDHFGQGSNYAVKKYGFDLTTAATLQIAVLIGGHMRRWVGSGKFTAVFSADFSLNMVSALSLAVALFVVTPGHKILDVSDMVSLETRIRAIGDALPHEPGKSNAVIGLVGVPHLVDYMFSAGLLETTEDPAVPDILFKGQLVDLTKYASVVSSRTNQFYNPPECKSSIEGELSIVAADCIGRHLAALSDCRSAFDFTSAGFVSDKLISGFSAPGEQGRWTEGPLARFSCNGNGVALKKVTLTATPFVYGVLTSQKLGLRINGVDMGEVALSAPRGPDNPIAFDISGIPAPAGYSLELRMPDATPLEKLGLNGDTRQLGVNVGAIRFE